MADIENATLRARIVELEETLRKERIHHAAEPAALQDTRVVLIEPLQAERQRIVETSRNGNNSRAPS